MKWLLYLIKRKWVKGECRRVCIWCRYRRKCWDELKDEMK